MQVAWIVGGVGVAAVATAVAVIVHTRWLQSRTLEKCVGLSLLLHAVLAAVCALVGGLAPASWGTGDEGRMTMLVVVADDAGDDLVATESAADADGADPVESAPASAEPPADLVPLLAPVAEAAPEAPTDAAPDRFGETEATPASAAGPSPAAPEIYADRREERRAAAAAARGGSEETERAVQAALAWLAAAQSTDGRWDAARHGAGRGQRQAGGHDPQVGARADHGVTGLALLAFLGAGTTHRDGAHAPHVRRGFDFLLARQRADGSLAGDAEFFAALYCHGMATLALAECAALTGDPALRGPLERAVRHTLTMQHPVTGGWRYAAGDRGDTSQLGWQVMALASARQAGIAGLETAEARARGFLQTVSSGAAGGLAAYRPGERPNVAMTAEALVCRMFLGMPADHPAATEAVGMLAASPPDRGAPNAYTWYYATLASFHCGGPHWDAWNARLQGALLPLQRRDRGPLEGSWDPDPVWGGHGGRVYATALGALMLEVYYRHLPMHERGRRMAAVP